MRQKIKVGTGQRDFIGKRLYGICVHTTLAGVGMDAALLLHAKL